MKNKRGISMMKRKLTLAFLLTCIFSLVLSSVMGAASNSSLIHQKVAKEGEVILATTTSTQDSGLLDYMLPDFEKRFGIKVKVIAVGTGQAIEIGKNKDADVVLVHARKSEDEFVKGGYGYKAHDLMYNQFYLVGPTDDPAGVKGSKTAIEAFQKIAQTESKFISRGDDSGTHKKEASIWASTGIKPEGKWYISAGQGMGATLQMADEMGAYTIVDEATYLTHANSLINLVYNDNNLYNPYGIIQVTNASHPAAANELIWYFISPDGKKKIDQFGKEKFGKNLFTFDAKRRQ